MTDLSQSVINNDPSSFVVVDVKNDDSWEYQWDLRNLQFSTKELGLTLVAASQPTDWSHSQNSATEYNTRTLLLRQREIASTPTTSTTAVTGTSQTTIVTTLLTTAPTTGQTTSITTVPTTSSTTITIVTPNPTATVNYSATIAAMQSQIAEQNTKITEQGNILNQIMTFLRNVFGLK